MDKKLPRSVSSRSLGTGVIRAVGVWFLAKDTQRSLYLLRNDPKHPDTWGLPGGKVNANETLLGGMERECIEELGCFPTYHRLIPLEKFTSSDGGFEYNTWVCVIPREFHPVLNREHIGYAWVNSGTWPRPMHPGLWSTVNVEEIKQKLAAVEQEELS